jgi:GAF domain-containing protein
MSAPETQRERQRLKILWEYQVLDTVPEEVFDQLTELAAHICEAPIALISLVDENRQWFKSKVGISLSQTSRDVSFCAHAIRQSGLFLVSDATKDPRFAQNPLVVSDPKIRFYAGAPLVTPDGHALGTLCVIDTVPRKLKPDQQQAMQVLARHVVSQLELRRRTRELVEVRAAREKEAANVRRLRAELAQARRELARLQRRKPSRRLCKAS